MAKDYDAEQQKPIIRVGFVKRIMLDHLIVYIPTLNEDYIIKFDGVNYYVYKSVKGV